MNRCLAILALTAATWGAHADEVSVAVAANFSAPMREIADAFAADTGHEAKVAVGSTGRFYAQIVNGAPFDVLLAADDEVPARLEAENLAAPGTRFTYAVGRLVLWSPQPDLVDDEGQVLARGDFARLAVADPKLAPYGAAAHAAIDALGLRERLQPRLVQGESIGQAYQFVASGNAPLGFVALSQVFAKGRLTGGSAWVVPAKLHAPLRQDAVVLARAADSPAAAALMEYLRGEKAREIMRGYGYAF